MTTTEEWRRHIFDVCIVFGIILPAAHLSDIRTRSARGVSGFCLSSPLHQSGQSMGLICCCRRESKELSGMSHDNIVADTLGEIETLLIVDDAHIIVYQQSPKKPSCVCRSHRRN